mmetsp:Transcript_10631/g.12090  ORF Transcript_10631/g.12090 Transcript_10631/m.12090 type:complete len:111 (+) Transcript_10631:1-333(+)
MGISNFGSIIGSYMGLGLMTALGTGHPEFHNLSSYVFLRTLFRFAPLLIIPILLPKGTPCDVSLFQQGDKNAHDSLTETELTGLASNEKTNASTFVIDDNSEDEGVLSTN